jgi:hypothetical protein
MRNALCEAQRYAFSVKKKQSASKLFSLFIQTFYTYFDEKWKMLIFNCIAASIIVLRTIIPLGVFALRTIVLQNQPFPDEIRKS